MCYLPQVVITDVDECLEALHENVSANLPSHCTLVASCLSQGQMSAAPVPRPASSSPAVATIPLDCERTGLANSSSPDHSAHDTAAVQEPNAAASSHDLSSSNGGIEQQDTRSQSAICRTEVLVAELEWGLDASSVAPPFDVVLIADVVSRGIFTCQVLMCHMHNVLPLAITKLHQMQCMAKLGSSIMLKLVHLSASLLSVSVYPLMMPYTSCM